jgi:Fe-S-cluster-containing dehydrogenase component
MEVCPSCAIVKDAETGIVKILEDRCSGCKACLLACPFGSIAFSSETGKAVKCELCDGEPECAALCPTGALRFEEADIAARQKQRDLAKKLGIIFEQITEERNIEEPAEASPTKLYEGLKK